MKSPITSAFGIMALVGALLTMGAHIGAGKVNVDDLQQVMIAATGAGLIAAKDEEGEK